MNTLNNTLELVRVKLRSRLYKWENAYRPVPESYIRDRTVPAEQVAQYTGVTGNSTPWNDELRQLEQELTTAWCFPGTADFSLVHLLYLLARGLRPHLVVETGVWIGTSSFALLKALRHNNDGARLISFDLPPFRRQLRVSVGHLVPAELRDHWRLLLTDGLRGLRDDIPTNQPVDLFVHDSDHSYRNMLCELRLIWPRLATGGVVVADDAHLNDAFHRFATEQQREPVFVARRKGGVVGILRK